MSTKQDSSLILLWLAVDQFDEEWKETEKPRRATGDRLHLQPLSEAIPFTTSCSSQTRVVCSIKSNHIAFARRDIMLTE